MTAAKHGPLGRRTRAALREAVEGSREFTAKPAGSPGWWPVVAEIARGVADTADDARAEEFDQRLWIAAARELRQLLSVLLDDEGEVKPNVSSTDGFGEGGFLAGLVGTGPTMGNEAES